MTRTVAERKTWKNRLGEWLFAFGFVSLVMLVLRVLDGDVSGFHALVTVVLIVWGLVLYATPRQGGDRS